MTSLAGFLFQEPGPRAEPLLQIINTTADFQFLRIVIAINIEVFVGHEELLQVDLHNMVLENLARVRWIV
jgi:hypothetical protein